MLDPQLMSVHVKRSLYFALSVLLALQVSGVVFRWFYKENGPGEPPRALPALGRPWGRFGGHFGAHFGAHFGGHFSSFWVAFVVYFEQFFCIDDIMFNYQRTMQN